MAQDVMTGYASRSSRRGSPQVRALSALVMLVAVACSSSATGDVTLPRNPPGRSGAAPVTVVGMFINENVDKRQIAITLSIMRHTDEAVVLIGATWRGDADLQPIASGIIPPQYASAVTLGPYSGPILDRSALSPGKPALVFLNLRITCGSPLRSVRGRITLHILLEGHSTTWTIPPSNTNNQAALTRISPLKICGESGGSR